MTGVDLIALGLIAAAVLVGARLGVARMIALAAFAVGALAGASLAPLLLRDGQDAEFALVLALPGALLCGALLAAVAERAALRQRRRVERIDRVRPASFAAGGLLGASIAVVLVWLAGAVAIQLQSLRDPLADSAVVGQLNALVPPPGGEVTRPERPFDPFPIVAGPPVPIAPVDPTSARDPQVLRADRSVAKVDVVACGHPGSGSAWVVADLLLVTNAHVVEAAESVQVRLQGTGPALAATTIWFDPRNDIALLRVPLLGNAQPLQMVDRPQRGAHGAAIGFPGGRHAIRPARLGRTTRTLRATLSGFRPRSRIRRALRGRLVTPARVRSEPGSSGGPIVGTDGRVLGTIFGGSAYNDRGFAVPNRFVRSALRQAGPRVSTGSCPAGSARMSGR